MSLAKRVIDGDLSRGAKNKRSLALAWCARFLASSDNLDTAEDYLNLAKDLGTGLEIELAQAFILSNKGDKNGAISALASIDKPSSRSAAFMIVANHNGSEASIDWLNKAGIKAVDLDSDGKHLLIFRQLELGQWRAAQENLETLTDEDFRETPILKHTVAITNLLSTVPKEFRAAVLNQIPFDAAVFPLASGASSLDARKKARHYFIDAAQVARQLNLPHSATIEDEYALWLELRDPDDFEQGKKRLEAKLRDTKSSLRLVPFGLQFGVSLNLEVVEQEIEAHIALHGGMTPDAATARFALAFTQKTPEDGAKYLAQHVEELSKCLDKKYLQILQIEMLSKAGKPIAANECLDTLLGEGLSEAEESLLRSIISEAKGADSVEVRREQFRKSDSLSDLAALVHELEAKQDWDGLCEYAVILFERTRSLDDAERYANSLSNSRKDELLLAFLQANDDLLTQSKNLQTLYSWALFYEGRLLDARTELAKLSDVQDEMNYRQLQVNLGIALGDWNSLAAFVANECLEKDRRSADDLLRAAHLALHLGSPHAQELIYAAVAKSNDNANVLAGAYFLATKAGFDDDAKVSTWLQRAAALSDDDGPIHKMTMKEVWDRKPEWDRRESETWQMLIRGDIPMFVAAQVLKKSLIDLMLFPALASILENDPRRRGVIPAYSGRRETITFDTSSKVVIDATALLTLSFLGLLDTAFDFFDKIYIPHSTLEWLFVEKQKATFHQPSRIREARQVRDLFATGALGKFMPSTVADSDLAAQIGDELARFLAEAKKVRGDDDAQHIVVRPYPVQRLGSLMEEEVDLTSHETVMSSCQAIVDKLREKGQITAQQVEDARVYLQLHEKPWPNQPKIDDGAILYLDYLAITYFLHLGILRKIQSAGLRPIASPMMKSETDKLISYESISVEISDAIERIRSAINSGIELGKIKVGKRHNVDKPKQQAVFGHPTAGVMALARNVDAIISDDRSFNQYVNFEDDKSKTPIFSTLDLLDAMVSTDSISLEGRLEYRTLLRRAGYLFVPVNEDELAAHLNASPTKDGKVLETAELKAIRENILQVRMSTWLQHLKEAPWLVNLFNVFLRVLKSLWKSDADFSNMSAYSDWIIDQVDVCGWSHVPGGDIGDNYVDSVSRMYILQVLNLSTDMPQEVEDKYWHWAEDRVLTPIKKQNPDTYLWIVDWYKKHITDMADLDVNEGNRHDE